MADRADSPKTFLITGARAPVALHLARLLHGAGQPVVLADSFAVPFAKASVAATAFEVLPPPRYALSAYQSTLGEVIARHGVDCILPTCEEVFHLATLAPALPVPVLAPPLDLLAQVHAKDAFIRLVADMGLPVPQTRTLTTRAEVSALADQAGQLVFKPVWSRFGTETLIRPNPRALERISPSPTAPWVAQDFVAGQEVSVYALALGGRVMALAAYRALYRAGPGAAISFARVEDAGIAHWVARFVEATGWDGQVSFDLIRQTDGTILPLECNPRATSGVHFFRDGPAFAAALAGRAETAPDVTDPQGVRLAMWVYGLPQALRHGRLGRFRRDLREMGEVFDWPGDPGLRRAQIATLAAIARMALRERVSLRAASTHDIEWNGPEG